MAFNASGDWTPENDDTQTQVAKVIDAGGPLMKQARGIGSMVASKRGLGNSSIAAGAVEGAVLDKATAIGGQTASQINAKNITGMNNKTSLAQTGMQIASNESIAAAERENAKALQAAQIKASYDNLVLELNSRKDISAADREAEMARLDKSLANSLAIANLSETGANTRSAAELANRLEVTGITEAGANTRQAAELASRSSLQTQADAAALERLNTENTSQKDIATLNNAAETGRLDKTLAANKENAQLEAGTRLNIAEMDRDQSAKNTAINATTTLAAAHMQSMAALMNNADIPADVRASYQKSIQQATEANVGVIEQITGTDLAWGNNTIVTGAGLPSTSGQNPYSLPLGDTGYTFNGGQSYRDANGVDNFRQADGRWLRMYPDGHETIFDPKTGVEAPR